MPDEQHLAEYSRQYCWRRRDSSNRNSREGMAQRANQIKKGNSVCAVRDAQRERERDERY